jgi:hypothetical protein
LVLMRQSPISSSAARSFSTLSAPNDTWLSVADCLDQRVGRGAASIDEEALFARLAASHPNAQAPKIDCAFQHIERICAAVREEQGGVGSSRMPCPQK